MLKSVDFQGFCGGGVMEDELFWLSSEMIWGNGRLYEYYWQDIFYFHKFLE